MKKHSLFNRILSGILAVLTVVSLIPLQASSAGTEELDEGIYATVQTEGFKITVDGEEKATLTLRSHEKIEICADGLMEAAQYQWQIQHPEKEGVWINIYDATSACLNVTLALVKNMLTLSRTTQLRCRAIVNEEPQFTPVITVIHDDTVVSAPVVIPEETTEPTEAATEPTTPVETTVPTEPVETTVPTEPAETTEPTVPETTAPVVIPEETVAPTEETVPVETTVPTEATEPVQTEPVTEPAPATEPAETVAPTEPAQTTPATEPVEAVTVTEPVQILETVAATEAAAVLEENHSQAEAMAAAESAPAEIAPVETVAETAPVATEPEAPIETQPAEEQGLFAALVTNLTRDQASAKAMDAEAQEFVRVTIEYIRYDFARIDGKLVTAENTPDDWQNPQYHGGYLLEKEGAEAFNPYVASLQYNTGLDTSVPIPTVVGYTAQGDAKTGFTINGNNVDVELTNIQSDITYTIRYVPAEVKYSVRYYFQNIYDDQYVENTAMKIVSSGYTGGIPANRHLNPTADTIIKSDYPAMSDQDFNDLKEDMGGFLPLYYQPDAIAADGSTVFEVYFERNYFLMEFNCNGGYGAETLYNRYGSYINVPSPSKAGWVFAGWDLIGPEDDHINGDPPSAAAPADELKQYANTLPESMPAKNTAYIAIWGTTETTYTVAYWIQEGTTKTFIGSRTVSANSGTTVSGTNDVAAQVFCGLVNHEHVNSCCTCGHVHVRSCVPNGWSKNAPGEAQLIALKAIGEGEPESGFIYRVERPGGKDYYMKFGTEWFGWSMGSGNTESLQGILLKSGDTITHNGQNYTAYKHHIAYRNDGLNCGKAHTADCKMICNKYEHAHTADCNPYGRHVEYVSSDNPKVVLGDGSTVMNQYYTLKTYTIRYIYARKSGSKYQIATLTKNGQLNNCTWTDLTSDLPTFIDPSGKTERSSVEIGGDTYYYISLKAKFGESIAAYWPSTGIGDVTGKNWWGGSATYNWGSWAAEYGTGYRQKYGDEHANIVGPYPIMSNDMVVNNPQLLSDGSYLAQNMIAWWGSGEGISAHAYHNYFEVINPPDNLKGHKEDEPFVVDGETYNTYNGKIYKLSTDMFTAAHNEDTRVDPVEFEGFRVINEDSIKQGSSLNYDNEGNCTLCEEAHQYCNTFYYDRIHYKMNFINHGQNLLHGGGSDVPYGMNLSGHGVYVSADNMNNAGIYDPVAGKNIDPYPSTLEPNAYVFTNWYTTENFVPGTEMNWNTTMPASDMVVYASWQPIKRDVLFFTFYDDIAALEKAYESSDGAGDGITNYIAQRKNGTLAAKPEHIPYGEAFDAEHGKTLESQNVENPTYLHDDRIASTLINGETMNRDTFIGWFYMDENNKKKFAPDTMEITQDLILFAEWNSSIDTTYKVDYVLKNAVTIDGHPYPAGTSIAPSAEGHSSIGKTKTFNSKGAGDLNAGFRKSYFPENNSHSILMAEDSSKNIYQFKYVYDAKVFYLVQYVNRITGERMGTGEVKIVGTNEAIVTEKFKPFKGFIAEQYYITKSLASDGRENDDYTENPPESQISSKNIITFYYVPDPDHGMYAIEYYLENVDSTDANNTANYTRREYIEGTADLKVDGHDNTITAEERTYDGFETTSHIQHVITYNDDGTANDPKNGNSGTVSVNGLTIKLYYKRKKFPYIVEYREYGKPEKDEHGNPIAPLKRISVLGDDPIKDDEDWLKFESEYTYSLDDDKDDFYDAYNVFVLKAKTAGEKDKTYEFVHGVTLKPEDPKYDQAVQDAKTKTITIRADATGEENRIVFYFRQKQVDVYYHAVCSDSTIKTPFGIVSPNLEMSDQLAGSKATPARGFRFVGWYKDKACTDQITDPDWFAKDKTDVIIPEHLKPKEKIEPTDKVNGIWENHYYALFEPVKKDLKIIKEGASGNDSFIFTVTGENVLGQQVNLTVSTQGEGEVTIKDLYCGDYTVTETDWSWEYDCAGVSINDGPKVASNSTAVVLNVDTPPQTIKFTNTSKHVDWLHGESCNENVFKPKT